MFKTNSSDSLYAFSSISDEWMNGTVYEFVVNSDNMLTAKELATIAVGPNADYTETISQYTMDGVECTESEYESFFDGLRYDASEVVMYNCNYENDEKKKVNFSYSDKVSSALMSFPAPRKVAIVRSPSGDTKAEQTPVGSTADSLKWTAT